MHLSLDDFDYHLPTTAIAQQPAEPRDSSRLLVSTAQGITDHHFHDLPSFLRPGDLLVLNDTKVIPARLLGHKSTGGKVEIFLLRPLPEEGHWLAMTRGLKKRSDLVHLGDNLTAQWLGDLPEGRHIQLTARTGDVATAIAQHGIMPLPPYIHSQDPERDKERYQTVYARLPGAVAAPTAGLHFTDGLLQQLTRQGIATTHVTLHVGLGTFQPVRENDIHHHTMHAEWCSLSTTTAKKIQQTRQQGGRIIAVGTTVTRVLESATPIPGHTEPFEGETRIFILPGYEYKAIDGLITNFHLPKSTLLMLVAAFIGKQRMDQVYQHAIARGYRFYSYGDVSLLLP